MKIVYVGDNRNRMNYGCRATSTALSQLLSENNTIVGRVHGNFRNIDTQKVFFISWLPKGVYEFLGKRKHWDIIKEWIVDGIHIWKRMKVRFSKFDFISMDFEKSINNLIKCIPANEELEECDLRKYDFDALVVNGEGSFIFSPVPWRESTVEAMLMYWAKKMGKKVYFLNGMFSGSPNLELNMHTINCMKDLFESIDYVGVRETRSYDFAKKYFPTANIELYPDALFTWKKYIDDGFYINNAKYFIGHSGATDASFNSYTFSEPYICISGSSASSVTKNRYETIQRYCELVNKVKEKLLLKIYIVIPCEIDNFLVEVAKRTGTPYIPVDTPILSAAKILANAVVYITGRYHPSILASLGGTPCIFMDSNSHKNFSLQETLEYETPHEYSAVPSNKEIANMIEEAYLYISQGEKVRKRIKERTTELANRAERIKDVIL